MHKFGPARISQQDVQTPTRTENVRELDIHLQQNQKLRI